MDVDKNEGSSSQVVFIKTNPSIGPTIEASDWSWVMRPCASVLMSGDVEMNPGPTNEQMSKASASTEDGNVASSKKKLSQLLLPRSASGRKRNSCVYRNLV